MPRMFDIFRLSSSASTTKDNNTNTSSPLRRSTTSAGHHHHHRRHHHHHHHHHRGADSTRSTDGKVEGRDEGHHRHHHDRKPDSTRSADGKAEGREERHHRHHHHHHHRRRHHRDTAPVPQPSEEIPLPNPHLHPHPDPAPAPEHTEQVPDEFWAMLAARALRKEQERQGLISPREKKATDKDDKLTFTQRLKMDFAEGVNVSQDLGRRADVTRRGDGREKGKNGHSAPTSEEGQRHRRHEHHSSHSHSHSHSRHRPTGSSDPSINGLASSSEIKTVPKCEVNIVHPTLTHRPSTHGDIRSPSLLPPPSQSKKPLYENQNAHQTRVGDFLSIPQTIPPSPSTPPIHHKFPFELQPLPLRCHKHSASGSSSISTPLPSQPQPPTARIPVPSQTYCDLCRAPISDLQHSNEGSSRICASCCAKEAPFVPPRAMWNRAGAAARGVDNNLKKDPRNSPSPFLLPPRPDLSLHPAFRSSPSPSPSRSPFPPALSSQTPSPIPSSPTPSSLSSFTTAAPSPPPSPPLPSSRYKNSASVYQRSFLVPGMASAMEDGNGTYFPPRVNDESEEHEFEYAQDEMSGRDRVGGWLRDCGDGGDRRDRGGGSGEGNIDEKRDTRFYLFYDQVLGDWEEGLARGRGGGK